MRIIKKATLTAYWHEHPEAEPGLVHWHTITKAADWSSLQDVKATFPYADLVTAKSGRKVVVFNIGGNKFRLIAAIHFNHRTVYVLMVLTHREYDRGAWKETL